MERGEKEVYRVTDLAQQIGINGDKLSWPVIDEAHRPWHEVTAACTMFSLAPRSHRRFYLDALLLFLHRYPRGIVSSVPLHAIAIVTISPSSAFIRFFLNTTGRCSVAGSRLSLNACSAIFYSFANREWLTLHVELAICMCVNRNCTSTCNSSRNFGDNWMSI